VSFFVIGSLGRPLLDSPNAGVFFVVALDFPRIGPIAVLFVLKVDLVITSLAGFSDAIAFTYGFSSSPLLVVFKRVL
jgi:hypothetical protein